MPAGRRAAWDPVTPKRRPPAELFPALKAERAAVGCYSVPVAALIASRSHRARACEVALDPAQFAVPAGRTLGHSMSALMFSLDTVAFATHGGRGSEVCVGHRRRPGPRRNGRVGAAVRGLERDVVVQLLGHRGRRQRRRLLRRLDDRGRVRLVFSQPTTFNTGLDLRPNLVDIGAAPSSTSGTASRMLLAHALDLTRKIDHAVATAPARRGEGELLERLRIDHVHEVRELPRIARLAIGTELPLGRVVVAKSARSGMGTPGSRMRYSTGLPPCHFT